MWTATFALFAIKHPRYPEVKKYCLVDEGARGWWLPGGGVDGPETFLEGGRREAMEEAGVRVGPDVHLLQIDTSPNKLRYILAGSALDESLKVTKDKESDGARWMTLQETIALDQGHDPVHNSFLRSDEPLIWFAHLEKQGTSYPLGSDDFIETSVEAGAKGVKNGKRDLYSANFQCVLACQIEGTDEFIVNMNQGKEPHLPSFPCNVALAQNLLDCAVKGLNALKIGPSLSLNAVLAIQDKRTLENELDFRVAFHVVVPSSTKLDHVKTAKAKDIVHDSFDQRSISRAMRHAMVALSIIAPPEGY